MTFEKSTFPMIFISLDVMFLLTFLLVSIAQKVYQES